MAIVGQNATLNQYVPTFLIKDLRDGQTIIYDNVRKAFVNVNPQVVGGLNRLYELLDVADSVGNPLSLQNGQSLTYNSFTSLWENKFTDYNTLLNKPTSGDFSFVGLSDTEKPSLPNGYVLWNSTGSQLVYSTTIPASSITGLATVATTGNYNDLLNKPVIRDGTVTSVSIVTANGIYGSVANPTTTPAITLALGAITPTSITATGNITGLNLTGTNTGDQTITLSGDVAGSGTGSFATTLSATGVAAGTYGSSVVVPVLTVDAKGRITNVVNTSIPGAGTSYVTERVSFKYTSGGAGNLTGVDSIHSTSPGVTPTIVDGVNCIVEFVFNGHTTPPSSITIYGQDFTTNTFSIVTPPSAGSALANFSIKGGGTATAPALIDGIFSSSNVLRLQLRMSDTGASSTLGNRAYALVVFGF